MLEDESLKVMQADLGIETLRPRRTLEKVCQAEGLL